MGHLSRSGNFKKRIGPAWLACGWLLLAGSLSVGQDGATHERFAAAYDAAHELTLDGTVENMLPGMPGSPAGVHVLLAGDQGAIDAHLGPYLSDQTKAALVAGAPVHAVGSMFTVHGKAYFLVRRLTIGGRTTVLRSPHGLLVPERPVDLQRSRRTGGNGPASAKGSGQ